MTPTIRDVARMAKVAPSTVSAVLNDKRYIRPETRARILSAIEKLDYTPRRSARGLANRTSGNVGFILSDSHFSRAEPFYTRVFLGTEFEARHHDLYVLLTSVNGHGRSPDSLPRFLREQNVDGIMIAGKVPGRLIRTVLRRGVPTVLIDYGDARFTCSKVLIDNVNGAALATRHLVERGHTAIGFIGGEHDHPSLSERKRGYCQAMRHAGLEVREGWIRIVGDEMSTENGRLAMKELWQEPERPTALVCANDAMAFGVMLAARDLGLRIPGDLSVVGFDDVATCTMVDPPLTTVRVNKEDLGATAVRVLVNLIRRGGQPSETRVGVELIDRGSTARRVSTAKSSSPGRSNGRVSP